MIEEEFVNWEEQEQQAVAVLDEDVDSLNLDKIWEEIEEVEEQEGLTEETEKRMAEEISQIKDSEARNVLIRLYCEIKGYEDEIDIEKSKAVNEIAREAEVPTHLLRAVEAELGTKNKEVIKEDLADRHEKGAKELEAFVSAAQQPYNFLYLNNNLSKSEIEKRMAVLKVLYEAFIGAPLKDRTRMESVLIAMFDIPTIPEDVQRYLDEVGKHAATTLSEGAENKNLIFLGNELQSQVIKISKGRHDVDFASILKLMYNMHAIALRFNHEDPPAKNVKVEIAFSDMTIYRDKYGNLKRVVRQKFAPGETIKELSRETMEDDPEFLEAWKAFLRRVDSMRETHGVVLDISDSTAGFKKERGNVANTGNVFVKRPTTENRNWIFTVIDPDVFDTEPGEHKFNAKEHIRKYGYLKGIIPALKTLFTNQARKIFVLRWQEDAKENQLAR